jgi:hypothetical protein
MISLIKCEIRKVTETARINRNTNQIKIHDGSASILFQTQA